MMIIDIMPEHVEGRFTNRRAWRVLSVGTDDDQVYLYAGKTHLPALQKGYFFTFTDDLSALKTRPFGFQELRISTARMAFHSCQVY